MGKEKALEVYEDTVRTRVDPALLEYAGGNTFSGRVFPIPPKGYNRVLIAYEELLPVSGDRALYRFPLPDCKLQEVQFALYANAEQCKDATFRPDDATKQTGGSQLAFTKTWTEKGPGGEVLFAHTPADPAVQAISARADSNAGPVYVYARVRPDLAARQAKPFAGCAVFLLDTSLSEHPDRFAVNMKLLKRILESDANIKLFNVLAFNVGAAWVEPGAWLPNTPAGRDKVFARLDGLVLEGATDLSAALAKLARPAFAGDGASVEVFLLSDGQITWGEADAGTLVARFEQNCPFPTRFHCYRTGLGADNAELFAALTRRGGGVFNCFTEADLPAALAHRQQCLQVERVRFAGGPEASDVLVAGRQAAVYPGGELVVAGKLAAPGRTSLLVEGTYQGQKFVEEYPVDASGTGELAARGWGELAVTSLLALNDPAYDRLVTAYCQQFGIGSRVASFLVLENANDYKRLNLEEERGKTFRGDLGNFLDALWKGLGKGTTAREAFTRFLETVGPKVKLFDGPDGAHVRRLLELLKDDDFETPDAPLAGALLRPADVPPKYLADRAADRRNVDVYLAEANRRLAAKDVDGAVRVLSSIIEEYPGRGDALRLVGYRLLDLGQPAHAARLFERVQRQRPFEPHSYLDLARSLEQSGKYGLAAVHYEIALAGTWHPRFHASLKDVAREDYGRMMRQAARAGPLTPSLADHFGERLEKMDASRLQGDLRVSMTWNTDATDVDLWVIEPDGTKCFYQHTHTRNGGELSQDMTQGYGPERYQAKKAAPGEYRVIVHYFGTNPNLLGGETHVSVTVTRFAGTAREEVKRYTVVLKKHNQEVEVCRVRF